MPLIRRARPEDAEAILDYVRVMFQESSWFTLTEPDEFDLTVEAQTALLEAVDWERGDQFWVAESEGAIVGTLTARPHGRRKMHHRLEFGMSVARSHWGQGIGRGLLRRCLEEARQNPHIHKVVLDVFADNDRALALYRSEGFVEEGRQVRDARRADGSWADNVRMALWMGRP